MRVMLATIVLNEMEWLPKLYLQHRNWPGLCGWVFVEGADPMFREANPTLVSKDGLSTDGTTEYLESICPRSTKLNNIDRSSGPVWINTMYKSNPPFESDHIKLKEVPASGDQGKCFLRNAYLLMAEAYEPDIIIQIDCDEFYTKEDQNEIVRWCGLRTQPYASYTAWMFRQRHVWHTPLFSQEVVGGYWAVPHTRVWRWIKGMRHVRNHNWPEVEGRYLTESMIRCDLMPRMPECVHMGYSSSQESRAAKAKYYIARGEGSEGGRLGRKRSMYNACRYAHLTWELGQELPHGAQVIPYSGPIPEVFR